MVALFGFLLTLFASSSRSKSRLEAENAALRHQFVPTVNTIRLTEGLNSGDSRCDGRSLQFGSVRCDRAVPVSRRPQAEIAPHAAVPTGNQIRMY